MLEEIQSRKPLNLQTYSVSLCVMMIVATLILASGYSIIDVTAIVLLYMLITVDLDYRRVASASLAIICVIMVLSGLDHTVLAERWAILLYYTLCISTFGIMYGGSRLQIVIHKIILAYRVPIVDAVITMAYRLIDIIINIYSVLHHASAKLIESLRNTSIPTYNIVIAIRQFVYNQYVAYLMFMILNYFFFKITFVELFSQGGIVLTDELYILAGGMMIVFAVFWIRVLFVRKKLR